MTQGDVQEPTRDIAVIGMAGRFPRARDTGELWRNLRKGVECISFFKDEELLAAGADPAELADKAFVKAWGWMEGADEFDAAFFDVSPREAEVTDPQIRLLLECAWEALEDAGQDPERVPGRTGVFAGVSTMTYYWENLRRTPGLIDAVGAVPVWIVTDRDFVATRLNYKLGLRGPGLTVQTACSTSLVAVHLGVLSLLSGESDLVLAGGASAARPEKHGYPFVEGGTFSPDGHVRAFDARAQGMLGGDGVGLVVLKRLEDALADGDNVRAVLKGTAINNDGLDKITFTAPSVLGQKGVILDALDVAGVEPDTIGYVEAHGTGTPLGDPIEVEALTQAWRTRTERRGWCPIGSIKTNIGHLDAAAGVAGLIKTVLMLEQGEIPPSLHFERPNPVIDFASSPFFVNTELRAWRTNGAPRRAAVSSLGLGGTNAHAILEEAPVPPPASAARPLQLLLVSARTASALERSCANLASHLAEEGARQDLADVAYTTQLGRRAFSHRLAVVAAAAAEAALALRGAGAAPAATGQVGARTPKVAFLFPGQGSQHVGMGAELYRRERVYRETLDRCCDLLAEEPRGDLRALLFPSAGGERDAARALERTENAQPALFAVELALASLLRSWGVEPQAMLGHSVGEYVAACLAGVLSLEDALALVAARGRWIGSLPEGGGMLAVQLSEHEARPWLAGDVALAAVNAPGLVVLSGPLRQLGRIERELEAKGVPARRLHTSHAFHSPAMDPILEPFARELERVSLHAPTLPVVSSSTGRVLTPAQATDPAYWVAHLREAVRFSKGVETLRATGHLLLEVGPGQVLSSLANATRGRAAPALATAPPPGRPGEELAALLRGLAELWTAGVPIDWAAFHAEHRRRRVRLPTYPFERQRYWIERPPAAVGEPASQERQEDRADWFHVPSWSRAAAPAPARPAARRWLVVHAGDALSQALCERARAAGIDVWTLRPGAGFARDARRLCVDPESAQDHRRALDTFLGEDGDGRDPEQPLEIVYTWALAGDHDELVERGFLGLLHLAQALADRELARDVRVDVVTSGVQDVLGEGSVAPSGALVLGPCMSMDLELDGVTARCIDLEDPGTGQLEHLLAELGAETERPVLALRSGRRWVLGHEPTRLSAAPDGPLVREGAVVLVTGGLGGVACALAEELARARARLVLVGRSVLPERTVWDAWLEEHDARDPVARRIERVRRLEALGAEVLLAAADCADARAMRDVVDETTRRFGSVDALVHAAGVSGSGLLALKTREAVLGVLRPKVEGTRVLREVLAGRELDFVLLCSSISAVTPGLGQADYAAANAYLDAAAIEWRRATGTRVVAVGWDAWREVGMAAEAEVPEALRAERDERLRLGIASEEGREALRRILASDLEQVIVSPRDLVRRADYRARFDPRERRARARRADLARQAPAPRREAPAAPTRPRPSVSSAFVAPRDRFEAEIAAIWADLLGLDRVGIEDDFLELGGNSLVMMQVGMRLRARYGISVPIRSFLEAPTVGLLAERVATLRALVDGSSDPPAGSADEREVFTL